MKLRKLSIKALIATVLAVIFLMALAATAMLFVTNRLTGAALQRYEQAQMDVNAPAQGSAAIAAAARELRRVTELSAKVTLATRIVTFFLGLVVAVLVYRRVMHMVRTTEEFAGRIERGEFGARFATDAGGETAALATVLNSMVARLNSAIESETAASRRLAFLMQTTPAVIYAVDASGVYRTAFISTNVQRQLGYAPKEFTDDPGFWASRVHPDDLGRARAGLTTPSPTGAILREYRLRHQDGSWRWVRDETVLVSGTAGEPLELIGSWIDITERKALETSLMRSDAILKAVAYGSARFLQSGDQDSVAEWNLGVGAVLAHLGEATGVSRVWVFENEQSHSARPIHRWALPEYAVADAEPLSAQDLHYERDGMGVEALRLRRGEVLQFRMSGQTDERVGLLERRGVRSLALAPIMVEGQWWGFMCLDDCVGDRQWSEVELEALRAAANLFGAAIGARARRQELRTSMESLGSVLEKLKRQSAKITHQNTELVLASRMKSEFLATVTHELRTPLNSVIGFAELLKDQVPGPLNPKQIEFAADIVACGEQLLALVEGILEMSRLDARTLEFEPVDVGAAIQACVAAQQGQASVRRLHLDLDFAADLGLAALDASALRRMLDALISNAIKFNRDGGTVTLRARRDEKNLEIAVTDSGIGIAAADLGKLFQPLVQLDTGLARLYGGIGLGLALARRLAEMHGGTIEVASDPGTGSTFTLRLPIAGEDPD